MITDEKIARINELAYKQKKENLTDEEYVEQHNLRKEYLESLKRHLRHHIEGVKLVDKKGNDITPGKLKEIQRKKGLHNRN
ncbi:MAG: DUF896 family protein [Lactobacillales bacterium]|jgi:uncharacterized protein YnzC (UPF0291/DUF896 family)|nr:DUF896 family protein [Lactobacillales bacterium]